MDTATEAVSFLSVFNIVFTQVYTNNFRREWLLDLKTEITTMSQRTEVSSAPVLSSFLA